MRLASLWTLWLALWIVILTGGCAFVPIEPGVRCDQELAEELQFLDEAIERLDYLQDGYPSPELTALEDRRAALLEVTR
jgi:hypothetical protein